MPFDPSQSGPDKTYKTVIEQVEKENGSYSDRVEKAPSESKIPVGLPEAPAPMPYKIEGGAGE